MIEFAKHHMDMERIAYVAQFVSKDPVRFILHNLYVEKDGDDTIVTATDGRILATVTLRMELEPGFYKVLKCNKSTVWLDKLPDDIGTYPNWRAVVPKPEGKEFDVNGRRELCYAAALLGCYIDFDNTMKMEITGKMYITDRESPILVVGEWHTSVVMPVRSDKDAVTKAEEYVEQYWREKIAKEMEGVQ